MRLVLLSTNMARGGAETQVARLAIELRRRQWDVHVVSLIQPTAFSDELASAGVPLHSPGVAFIPALLRKLRPQIIHCHMFHANVLGRSLRVFMPFPAVISTLHSMAETGRASTRIGIRDFAYRATNTLADVTVAVSQAVAQRHARVCPGARMIPNGVDTTRFRPDRAMRETTRAELGVRDDEFVWIAVGRLMWKKNYPALLHAFARVGQGLLLIVGTGPDEQPLREMAGANVRFLGSREDIPALLNAADAFVMTSVIEGLPVALLEAAATALPCVSTPAGGVAETGIGIVTEDIEGAMRRVLRDRGTLGEEARRIVIERYSMDAVVSQWEALYRSM
jgi:glycosyltransferase involved in cell wall biosynthesis